MKQSPPRPCYLSSRCCISSRDGDDIGGKEEGRAKCASVHEAAWKEGRVEGGRGEKGKEETGGSYSTIETTEDFPEALSCSSKR